MKVSSTAAWMPSCSPQRNRPDKPPSVRSALFSHRDQRGSAPWQRLARLYRKATSEIATPASVLLRFEVAIDLNEFDLPRCHSWVRGKEQAHARLLESADHQVEPFELASSPLWYKRPVSNPDRFRGDFISPDQTTEHGVHPGAAG